MISTPWVCPLLTIKTPPFLDVVDIRISFVIFSGYSISDFASSSKISFVIIDSNPLISCSLHSMISTLSLNKTTLASIALIKSFLSSNLAKSDKINFCLCTSKAVIYSWMLFLSVLKEYFLSEQSYKQDYVKVA